MEQINYKLKILSNQFTLFLFTHLHITQFNIKKNDVYVHFRNKIIYFFSGVTCQLKYQITELVDNVLLVKSITYMCALK